MFSRWMSALSIQKKIVLLLMCFALPLLVLGVYAVRLAERNISATKNEIEGGRQVQQVLLAALRSGSTAEIDKAHHEAHDIADRYQLTLDPDLDSYYLQYIMSIIVPELAVRLQMLANGEVTPVEYKGFVQLALYHVEEAERALALARKHDEAFYGASESLKALVDNLQPEFEEFRKVLISDGDRRDAAERGIVALRSIVEKVGREFENLLVIRLHAHERDERYTLLACGATLAILPIISWLIVRNITVRLQRLHEVTLRTAHQGDLSTSVVVSGSDEVSDLTTAFNGMVKALRGMVGKIVQSGSLISTSSSEIAAVSRQQQATTAQIAATTTEIESTSKRIATTADDLSRNMQEVRAITADAATRAVEGQQNLQKMRSTMQGITESSSGISQRLAVLNQHATKIGDVVTAIAKVADQTNLLSLNAAIEAEKAGEFGHGFAVVAREIRRLADQTAASTIDIEKMVREIQSAVAAGVMGMEKFGSEVQRGAQEVEHTSNHFSAIIDQIQTLSPTFQTVADGMGAQVLGARQITESLSQLGTAVRQTAESLSQSNLSIEQLHQATLLLQEEVQKFQLGERS